MDNNAELEFYIDINKSIRKNAEFYYEQAKRYKSKLARLESLSANTKNKKNVTKKKKQDINVSTAGQLKFVTSAGKKIFIGKNAKQNELLFSRHAKNGDLLFHADIIGASLVLLKDGEKASEKEKLECAQIAACYSNAWKLGYTVVDVYSFKPDQVEKSLAGLYVGQGSFVIIGKKEWYKQNELKLKIGTLNDEFKVIPYTNPRKLDNEHIIVPGSIEKEEFCMQLAKEYSLSADYIASLLPSGKMAVSNQ